MDIVYGMVFPYLVLVTLVSVVFTRNKWSLVAKTIATAVIPLVETLVVFFLFKIDARLLTTVIYPILLLTTHRPVTIFALSTINDTRLGTSSRINVVDTVAPVIPVAAWLMVLTTGLVCHSLLRNEANMLRECNATRVCYMQYA